MRSRDLLPWLAAGVLCASATVAADSGTPSDEALLEGGKLYAVACAACHGVDGSGLQPDHPNYDAFDPRPRDLTDPLFNSREPRADWFLVTKHGGPSLGLSDQMPGYGEAFSDDQIHAVIDFIKLGLVDASKYPPGDLNFPRPVRTIKAFPEDEALILTRYVSGDTEFDPNQARQTLYFGKRFAKRWMFEVKGSRSVETGAPDDDYEGELGVKWAFYDDLDRMLLMAAGLEAEIPEDSDAEEVWIPYYSVAKGLSEAVTFQGTLRSHLPGGSTDGGDLEVSGVFHFATSQWPRSVTPGVELILSTPFDSDEDVFASVLPQMLIGLSKSGHVSFALGAELPLTETDWSYRMHAFLLWDFADGMFWSGW